MLKKRLVYFFGLLIIMSKPYAQVNLQTGSATFSLPMFNWQDDKSRLNSVVALSYSSGSGLKVNDVASNVGQGWSLVQGGVITRMQVGEPDDQVANESSDPNAKYPSGILYATVPAYNGCPNALTKYPLYKKQDQVYSQHNVIAEDKQLDYFAFQFNGKAGIFIVDPSDIGNCKSLGDTKMKITFQQDASMINQGIRTRITSFIIQDVDGLIYKFTLHGLSKVLTLNYCDNTLYQLRHLPKFRDKRVYQQTGFDWQANPWIIGSWYLSEIEDPLTQRKIFFNYVSRSINANASNINAGTDFSYNSEKDYAVVTYKKSVTQTSEISSIVYPDGHIVTFNYNSSDRIDFNGEKALSSVDITYNGRFLSKHQLNTTYVIRNRYGNPITDFQKQSARLYLKSIQKIGPDLKEDSPPYIFDYYLGSNADDDFVPPPFFYAKDIWGFYNGKNSVRFEDNTPVPLNTTVQNLLHNEVKGLCFMHSGVNAPYLNAKGGYARNGLLRQIIYPTGGTLTYEYEQNYGKFPNTGSDAMVGGVHVSKTASTDGSYSNGCDNPITTQYNYILATAGNPSSLWGLEMPVNGKWTASHYVPEDKKYHWTLSCPFFGCCYYKYMYPGILSASQSLDLSGFQQLMNVIQPVLNILSIVGTVMDVATLLATAEPGFGTIAAVVIDILANLVTVAITCFTDYSKDPSTTVYYNMDLNGISPLPAQFKRVEIIEGTGGIGKSVQTFTSDEDYSLWFGPNTNTAYAAKQRFAPWAYGLPRFTTVYDVNGNKVKETENQYDFTFTSRLIDQCLGHCTYGYSNISSPLVACKCDVIQSHSQNNIDWSNPALYNATYITPQGGNADMKVDYYGMYSGRTQLQATLERIFKKNDASQFVETSTFYYYNDNNYEPYQILTIGSDGVYHYKDIKYTIDYSGGVITTLLNNNIVNLPVETRMSVSAGTLSEQVMEFTQLANGDIRPLRTLEQRFNQPQTNITLYGGPGSNTSNYKITQTLTYDANSNLTGVKDEGNRTVTNIYGYSNKYIVASVINADPITDKSVYSSFENSSETNPGGWVINGIMSYNNSTVPAVTGKQTYALLTSGASTLTASSLNTSKAYTLSFWANNNNVTVVGNATLSKTGPTYNGYTYYEYGIAPGTSSVTVRNNTTSANANIDELRLYPQTARMRSVTYDEIIGKTSECDENNRITYYEYDNLGRLRFIKDEGKNIVKMYEYNNVSASKQSGCPTTYYNHFIQEIFKKDCGSGFVGTDVPVTVAANTYSSSISQADADAKAENWLLTNGQSIANSGGNCLPIFYSKDTSANFETQCEQEGYLGNIVSYVVPYGRYTSIISQSDADEQMRDDVAANGQSYANTFACTNTSPNWIWQPGGQSRCQSVNCQLPPHLFVLATDMNPLSSTYNQTSWQDAGPDAACPADRYYNSDHSGNYYSQNCSGGQTPQPYYVSVPPGMFSSTISCSDAENQATQYGQNLANANGGCTQNTWCSFSDATGFHVDAGSPSNNGTWVSFYIVFHSTSGTTYWWGNNTVAIVSAGCRPSVTRQFSMSENGRTWWVTVTTSGDFTIQLLSGTPPSGTEYIALTNGSYNL